jgi:hypothetical protein
MRERDSEIERERERERERKEYIRISSVVAVVSFVHSARNLQRFISFEVFTFIFSTGRVEVEGVRERDRGVRKEECGMPRSYYFAGKSEIKKQDPK